MAQKEEFIVSQVYMIGSSSILEGLSRVCQCYTKLYLMNTWMKSSFCIFLYFKIAHLIFDPCLNVLHHWIWFYEGKMIFFQVWNYFTLRGCFSPLKNVI